MCVYETHIVKYAITVYFEGDTQRSKNQLPERVLQKDYLDYSSL